jgi:hypothetical protein
MKFLTLVLTILTSCISNCQNTNQLYGNWIITQYDTINNSELNNETIGFVYSQIMTTKDVDYISIEKNGTLILVSTNSKSPNHAFYFKINKHSKSMIFHVVSYNPVEPERFSINFIDKDNVELTNQYGNTIKIIRVKPSC